MQVTALGLPFLLLLIVCLCGRRNLVPWALSAAMPFSQSAAVIIAGNTLQPFYLIAFAAVAYLCADMLSARAKRPGPFTWLVVILLAIVALGSLVLPFVFEGTPVLVARGGIDEQAADPGDLQFSISNVAQTGYAALACAVVLFVSKISTGAKRYLALGFGIGTLLNGWALGAWALGRSNMFPSYLFDTNPKGHYYTNYDNGARIRGIFAEPSMLATFTLSAMVFFVALALVSRGSRRALSVGGAIVNGLVLLSAFSGTGLIGFLVVATFAVFVYGGMFALGRAKLSPTLALLGLALFVVVTFIASRLVSYSSTLITDKIGSSSFDSRGTADQFSVRIFADTFGLGVGLGSSRPSSFLAMLISNVGLVGTLLFVALIACVIRAAWRNGGDYAPSMWALIAVIAAKVVGEPNMSAPVMWMAIAVCASSIQLVSVRSRDIVGHQSARAVLTSREARRFTG